MIRAFCTCLVLGALAWPAAADDAKPLTTILLVANAGLQDPNFKGSVVVVMNNIGPAPVGIIVNRPTSIAVSRLFPDVEHLAHSDDKVYFGGPVEITGLSFLVRTEVAPEHGTPVLPGVYLSTDGELLRQLLDREKPLEGLRIFIGYSGWAPGQLEAEIGRGDWSLAPATASAIFDGKSERPWPEQAPPDDEHHT